MTTGAGEETEEGAEGIIEDTIMTEILIVPIAEMGVKRGPGGGTGEEAGEAIEAEIITGEIIEETITIEIEIEMSIEGVMIAEMIVERGPGGGTEEEVTEAETTTGGTTTTEDSMMIETTIGDQGEAVGVEEVEEVEEEPRPIRMIGPEVNQQIVGIRLNQSI